MDRNKEREDEGSEGNVNDTSNLADGVSLHVAFETLRSCEMLREAATMTVKLLFREKLIKINIDKDWLRFPARVLALRESE